MSDSLLTSIGQIAIHVEDPQRAKEFYRDKLGLTLLFEAGALSFFDCGGVRLMLSRAEGGSGTHSSIVYYRCSGIQDVVAQLKARGVVFESEPHMIARMPDHELWMGFFRDSESNLVGVMEEVPS